MSDFEHDARHRSLMIGTLEGDDPEVDDFDELDQADRILGSAPGGHTGLDGKVGLRDQRWHQLNEVAPFARPNPPSVLKGTLGGQQTVTVGTNKQVALWGGEDAETLPVTVVFAPVQQVRVTDPGAAAVLRPFGIVKFGTRGFLVDAEVDIGRGVQFTVNASEVSLQVGLQTSSGFAPPSMQLAGMLSFWPTTHRPPVTRTLYFDTLTDAAIPGPLTAAPAFARGVMLVAPMAAGARGMFQLDFYNSIGNVEYSYTYPAVAAGSPPPALEFIPLSGEIAFVTVTPDSPVEDYCQLIYELAF